MKYQYYKRMEILELKQNVSYINNKFTNISLPKHFHEEYSLSLIYDGIHRYENEKNNYNLNSGIIQVVNPYEFHTTQNSSWAYLNIMPTATLVNSIAKDILQNDTINTIVFKSTITDIKAIELFQIFFRTLENKNINKLEIDTVIISFFEYILKYHSSFNSINLPNITCSKKDLNKALEYINDSDINDNLSLENISSEIGISKYHFLKEFKKHIGITPNQYIQIKKINKTKELIQKDIPLSHIAYECGFNDQSYMIKVFKKFYGYTPSNLGNIHI